MSAGGPLVVVRAARRFSQSRTPWLVLVVVLFGLGATACTASKAVLGSSASPCYRAVPAAAAAVGRHGHFVGVRATDTTSLIRALAPLRKRTPVPRALKGKAERVCVISYRGSFVAGSVRAAWQLGHPPVGLAAVVVRTSDARPLATILIDPRAAGRVRALPFAS